MTVRLVSETEEAERARLKLHAIQPDPAPKESVSPPKEARPGRADLIEALATLARIAGFRWQLFAAFIGALGVGGYAVVNGSLAALAGAVIYNAMVLLPIAWIAFKRG